MENVQRKALQLRAIGKKNPKITYLSIAISWHICVVFFSVMGNPRKLGRKLIRRGSAAENKEDLRAPALVNNIGRTRPPMLRTQTMDNSEMK